MNCFLEICFSSIILSNVIFVSEIIFRFMLFLQEIIKYRDHYMPFSYNTVFKVVYTCNFKTIFYFILSILICLILSHFDTFKTFYSENKISYCMIFAFILVYLLNRGIGTDYSTLSHVYWIRNNLENLDFGSGMASNYYYGYLNIIGPNHGDERQGITERIENYQDSHRVAFPVKKLFIIVPESLFIPTNLNESSEILEQCTSLEELLIDRAGVRRRHYQNSVYRILNNNNWYICAEGATPLQTFRNALDASGQNGTMKLIKHEIVLKFVTTLKRLIYEHESTRHKFEVVYYNDNDDTKGRQLNVGEIIVQRIKNIQRGINH